MLEDKNKYNRIRAKVGGMVIGDSIVANDDDTYLFTDEIADDGTISSSIE